MRNCSKRIELLAPAGGEDCLKAAVNNGCDAVYLGGRSFSARSMAENFDGSGLEAAIDYAHVRGVKVYITVNTLYTDGELDGLAAFCAEAARMGADAFIVQDIGAARFLGENFGVNLHASTQLSARTAADAEFLKRMGFKRIVLSRETPLDEIEKIARVVECEVFVHGALCYSYSGQCLMSAFAGGRSGNRGNCAQPCRLDYELMRGDASVAKGCLLSPKDMMTLELLPEIISAGASALKIEGRMKSPQYVALATKAYRERLDSPDAPSSATELAQVFSRGGSFSDGYFKKHSSPDMMSKTAKSSGLPIGEVVNYIPKMGKCVISLHEELVGGDGILIHSGEPVGAYYNSSEPARGMATVSIRTELVNPPKPGDKVYRSYDKRLDDRLKKLAAADKRLKVTAEVTAIAGKALRLALSYGPAAVEELGGLAERSVNQPVTGERLLAQLSRTGGTPFELEFTRCEIEDNIYVSIKTINDLRRTAVAGLASRLAAAYKRDEKDYAKPSALLVREPRRAAPRITVLASNPAQAEAALSFKPHRLYLECNNLDALDTLAANPDGVKIFAALPACPWPDEEILFARLEASGIDGYLARTYGHLLRTAGSQKEIALDYSFNVMNTLSLMRLKELASSVCISPEAEQIPDERAETVIYGRITLMTTNLCPVGMYASKKGEGLYCAARGEAEEYSLIDRKGAALPIIRDCEACTARILSRQPERRNAPETGYLRIAFTTETAGECARILREYGCLQY